MAPRAVTNGASRFRLEEIGADRRISPSRLLDPRSKSPHRARSFSPDRPAARGRYVTWRCCTTEAHVERTSKSGALYSESRCIPRHGNLIGQDGRRVAQVDIPLSGPAQPVTRGRAKNRTNDATNQDILVTVARLSSMMTSLKACVAYKIQSCLNLGSLQIPNDTCESNALCNC